MTVLTKCQIRWMLGNMKRARVWGNEHDQCTIPGNITVVPIIFLQIICGSNYNYQIKQLVCPNMKEKEYCIHKQNWKMVLTACSFQK